MKVSVWSHSCKREQWYFTVEFSDAMNKYDFKNQNKNHAAMWLLGHTPLISNMCACYIGQFGWLGQVFSERLLNPIPLAVCPLRASVSTVLSTHVVALCLGFTVCTRSQSCYSLKGFFSLSPSLCLLHDSFLRGYFVCFSDLVCIQHPRAFRFGSYSFNRYLRALLYALHLCFPGAVL